MKNFPTLTRRDFLGVSGTGLAAGLAGTHQPLGAAENGKLLIIDCHAHIYGEDETKYPIRSPWREQSIL